MTCWRGWQHGFAAGPETPSDLDTGGTVEAELDGLLELVGAVRLGVAATFTEPGELGERIWATCRHPRVHLSLESAERAGAEWVELLQLSDVPSPLPDRESRAAVSGLTRLEVLAMARCGLGAEALELDLSRLGRLRSLDLSENSFETVPRDILVCSALAELYLDDNPVLDVRLLTDPDVLPRLSYVGLSRTDLSKAALAELSRSRPDLVVG